MRSAPLPRFALLFGIVGAIAAAASCSEDGVTPNCPPLPLYQSWPLGDASIPDAATPDSPEVQKQFALAVKAGCATTPITSGGGSGVAAGGSGAGSEATSHAGTGGSNDAGAAGGN